MLKFGDMFCYSRRARNGHKHMIDIVRSFMVICLPPHLVVPNPPNRMGVTKYVPISNLGRYRSPQHVPRFSNTTEETVKTLSRCLGNLLRVAEWIFNEKCVYLALVDVQCCYSILLLSNMFLRCITSNCFNHSSRCSVSLKWFKYRMSRPDTIEFKLLMC